jgi:DNA-binding transcriptional ArsR family regulator
MATFTRTATQDDACLAHEVHQEALDAARQALPAPERIEELAGLCKALGEPARLAMLLALGRGELCVCDLAALTGCTPSAVSHQLRLLRAAGLVQGRREGKNVFYSLAAGPLPALLERLPGALGAPEQEGD